MQKCKLSTPVQVILDSLNVKTWLNDTLPEAASTIGHWLLIWIIFGIEVPFPLEWPSALSKCGKPTSNWPPRCPLRPPKEKWTYCSLKTVNDFFYLTYTGCFTHDGMFELLNKTCYKSFFPTSKQFCHFLKSITSFVEEKHYSLLFLGRKKWIQAFFG